MNAIINDYPTVLEDVEYLHKVERIRPRMFEFTDFHRQAELHVTDVGASFHHKVTCHKSCPTSRACSASRSRPSSCSRQSMGSSSIEMVHAERCCGFGGTFSFKEPEISAEIVKEKCATIIETGADVVCGADVRLSHEHQGRACAPACAGCGRP